MRRLEWLICLLAAAISAAPAIARDDVGYRGWGPRFGVTIDPDQVHFGLHLDFGQFAERFRIQPNVELGLSDNRTLFCLNGEIAYRFLSRWDRWSPYMGGGIGVILRGDDRGLRRDDSDADLGASLLGGIEKGISGGDRFFMEAKVGLVDAPDLKFAVGWTFH